MTFDEDVVVLTVAELDGLPMLLVREIENDATLLAEGVSISVFVSVLDLVRVVVSDGAKVSDFVLDSVGTD